MSNISGFVKRLRDIMRSDPGINGDAQRIEQIAWMLFLKVYSAKEEEWKANDKNYVSIIPEEIQWKNWAHKNGLTGDDLLKFVNETVFPKLKAIKVSKDTEIRKAIVYTTFADANQYMKDGVSLRQVVNVIDEIDFSDYEESHAFGEIYESILKELQSAGSSGEFYTPRAVTDFMAQMIQPEIGEKMADFACGTGGFITSWLKQLENKVVTADDQKKYADSVYGIEKKQFPYMLCVTNLLLHDVDNPKVYHDNSLQYDVLNYTDDDRFDVILMNPPYGGSEKADIKNHFPDDLASSETADLFMSVIMYRLKKNGRAAVIIPDGFLFGNDNAKNSIKKKLLTEFNLHTIVRLPGSVFSPYTSITTNILFFNYEAPKGKTWFYRVDIPSDRKHFSKTKPMELKHFADCVEWWNNRVDIPECNDDGEVVGYKAKCYTATELAEADYNLDLCGYPHEEEVILSVAETIQNYEEMRSTLNADIDNLLAQLTTLHEKAQKGDNFPSIENIGVKNLETKGKELFQLNAQIGTLTKKAILQEAVQGKLVPQIASEGNAKDLLEQIKAEKAKLVKEGKIKKEKPLPEITEDEIPFDIPENWCWVRWGELSDSIQYGYNASAQEKGKIKMVRISDIQENKVLWDTVPYCEIEDEEIATYLLKENDILFARTGGTVGKSFLVKNIPCDAIYAGYLIRTHYNSEKLVPEYLKFFMESELYWSQLKNGTIATAQPNCNGQTLSKMIIPLPPLSEQKRIVEAIEKLLPYCEKLGRE